MSGCGFTLLVACAGLLCWSADARVLGLAGNTLWLAGGVCLMSLPWGVFLAVAVSRTDLPMRRAVLALLLLLLLVPLYLHATAWDAGLGKLGWLTGAVESAAKPLLHGLLAAVWIHSLWSLPWVTLFVAVALWWSEPEWEESAMLETSRWQVFTHVTLRRAVPGILVAVVWVLLTTATEIVVTDLYQVRTLAEELYVGFALADDPATTFGSSTAIFITGALMGVALLVLNRWWIVTGSAPRRGVVVFPLGRWRWAMMSGVGLTLAILVLVPVGNLLYQAGLTVEQFAGRPATTWSWTRFSELMIPWPSTYRFSVAWEFRQALGWTLAIAASAATASLLVAVPLAWWGRRGGWRAGPALLVAATAAGTMGPLVGVLIIRWFGASNWSWMMWAYDRTVFAPVLAATWRGLPLTILLCWFAFAGLSEHLVDAARVDGAGPLRRLISVGVRSRLAALAAAWLVALALASGELSASILVVPPGMSTVSIRVFGLLHSGVGNQAAALCLTNLLILSVAALAVATCVRRMLQPPSAQSGN